MRNLRRHFKQLKAAGKELVVRTCLTADYLMSIPLFVMLIWIAPEKYADTLAQSGETIRRKIAEYRKMNITLIHACGGDSVGLGQEQDHFSLEESLREFVRQCEAHFGSPCTVVIAADEPTKGYAAGFANVSGTAGEGPAFFLGHIAAKVYSGEYGSGAETKRRYKQTLTEAVEEHGGGNEHR